MGSKISTETGQSTKLGLDHRHLKSGLVKWFHYTIIIFSNIFFIYCQHVKYKILAEKDFFILVRL